MQKCLCRFVAISLTLSLFSFSLFPSLSSLCSPRKTNQIGIDSCCKRRSLRDFRFFSSISGNKLIAIDTSSQWETQGAGKTAVEEPVFAFSGEGAWTVTCIPFLLPARNLPLHSQLRSNSLRRSYLPTATCLRRQALTRRSTPPRTNRSTTNTITTLLRRRLCRFPFRRPSTTTTTEAAGYMESTRPITLDGWEAGGIHRMLPCLLRSLTFNTKWQSP